jgi:hypothetical protein
MPNSKRVLASDNTAFPSLVLLMQVANDTIIMLIGLVYCVIQPIIAPLALIYFAIGMLIWKYQVVYVYVPLVESGGKVWVMPVILPCQPCKAPLLANPNCT